MGLSKSIANTQFTSHASYLGQYLGIESPSIDQRKGPTFILHLFPFPFTSKFLSQILAPPPLAILRPPPHTYLIIYSPSSPPTATLNKLARSFVGNYIATQSIFQGKNSGSARVPSTLGYSTIQALQSASLFKSCSENSKTCHFFLGSKSN